MLKIRDTSAVKQWTWVDPETGHIISHFGDYNGVSNAVKIFLRANDRPIGSNWNEQLTAILCQHLPNACVSDQPPSLVEQAASVSRALFRWARQGFPTRSTEEVTAVTEICQACEHYGGETGIFKVICKKCGCHRKKTAIATEHCPIGKW